MKKLLKKINPDLPQQITDISKAIAAITTGLTGRYASPQLAKLGDYSQRIISEGLLSATKIELDKLIEEGEIKKEYLSSKQAQYNLTELLKFLDDEIPDEKKFEVLKNILLVASTEKRSTRDDVRPQQYMKIVKALPSGAILIMTTCYKISKEEMQSIRGDGTLETDDWRKRLAEKTGLLSYELVCNFEEILQKNRLINTPNGMEKVYVSVQPYFRLTKLGYDIMDYANELNKKLDD